MLNTGAASAPATASTAVEADILATMTGDSAVIDSVLNDGVPFKQILVLVQSAHLDWNWQMPNLQYFRQGGTPGSGNAASVQQIFADVAALLAQNPSPPVPGRMYPYSLAEVGYLMQYLERNPGDASLLSTYAPWFSLAGGAIETPDDILPHGEAFIRTYLLTRLWAEKHLPNTLSDYAYLPDNFGHTPCLPITFEAMGMAGFGFARCPGTDQNQNNGLQGPALVNDKNVDFIWQTADGSTTQAHYLQNGYSQGWAGMAVSDLQTVLTGTMQANPGGGNALSVLSPYVMVAFGGDFPCPVGTPLFDLAAAWNDAGNTVQNGIYAVLGTIDQYMSLVAAWNARSAPAGLPTLSSPLAGDTAGGSTTFWGMPYWTGFYATGPEVKALHQHATRALLAAESLGAIASLGPATWGTQLLQSNLEQAWLPVAISTSHNVITACGPNSVAYGESLPLLRYAHDNAKALRRSLHQTIANAIDPQQSPQSAVVLFNELGFARTSGLVAEYRPDPSAGVSFTRVQSVVPSDGSPGKYPAFPAPDGSLHVIAPVSSLGYSEFSLSSDAPGAHATVQRTPASGGAATIVLSNTAVSVSIATGSAVPTQSFITVTDPATSVVVSHGLRIVNDDSGGLFRFGSEINDALQETTPGTCEVTYLTTVGTPLLDRERFSITLTPEVGKVATTFTLEVSLAAGDAYAAFTIEGAASSTQAVMAAFASANGTESEAITGVLHGTPHYFNTALPAIPPHTGQGLNNPPTGSYTPPWLPPYFFPTHEYVTFMGGTGTPLFSVYHSALHAWSVQVPGETPSILTGSQAIACLYRNAPGTPNGACGSDPWTHAVRYAIRVGSGLPSTATLLTVSESRAFVSPLEAITPLTQSSPGSGVATTLVPSYSLADAGGVSASGGAIVNAAKVGSRKPTISGEPPNTDESLVLRVFTLTPGSTVTVTVVPTAASINTSQLGNPTVTALTALEEPLDATAAGPLAIDVTGPGSFTFVPQRALTTLQITWSWNFLPVQTCP